VLLENLKEICAFLKQLDKGNFLFDDLDMPTYPPLPKTCRKTLLSTKN
jgi:hypothetical protein